MANRFPLVLDTTDNNKIKEIQAGDNLNLADNSIVNVQNITAIGTINAADIRVAGNRLVAQSFADLTDTPNSFFGAPNYFVKVKADGSGLEYRPLSDLGNIEIDTITVDTSIVPTVNNTGNVGSETFKFNEIVATTLKGNLVDFNETIVFNATTGLISYAALQGAPRFLSEFTDDVGYLRTQDLDDQLAGLFDQGQVFVTDIEGSVFGDDSTLLVDAVASIITGDVLNTSVDTTELNAGTVVTTEIETPIVKGPATGDLLIEAVADYNINIGENNTAAVNIYNAVIETFDQGSGLGVAQITADTDLSITAGNRIKIAGGVPFKFASITSAEQLSIGAQNGDVIYNTTTSRLQMYQGSEWKDVNGNVDATTGISNFNDIVVAGNLTVQGTTTTIDTANTTIKDNVIVLNQGELGAGVTLGTSGIEIERGSSANKTLVWNESVDKWTIGSETFVAGTVEAAFTGILGGVTPAAVTGTTINGTTITATIGFVGNLTGNTTGAHTGTVDGDLTGSVFADDSGILVDAVNGTIPAENITGTANIDVVGNILGNVTGNVTGNAGTVTNGVYTTGAQTIGGAKTFSSTILGNLQGNVTGNVTGNIDNTALTIGAATATTISIGRTGSTTTINGTVNLPALIAGEITADNSISITTATGDGNAISIGPQGTNTFVNLTANNIRFFGPVTTTINATGGVRGDLKGSVVADDSTILVDAVNGVIPYTVLDGAPTALSDFSNDLDYAGIVATTIQTNGLPVDTFMTGALDAQGNNIESANLVDATGNLTGDVVGSVFGDDSSVMVDAVNYAMFSDTLSLTPLNVAPSNPTNGMIAVADGTGWNPASNGKNTLVAYLGGTWRTVAAAA